MTDKKNGSSLLMPPLTLTEMGKVLAKLRIAKPNLTIRELAKLANISPSYASKLLKRERSADSSGNV